MYIDPVGDRPRQVGHDLHPQPPVIVHGVVAGVRLGSSQGMGDGVDNRGRVSGATVAVGMHGSGLLIKVLLAVVLAHHLRQLIPHPIGDGLDALGAVEARGSDEVARFHHTDLHTQRMHLIAQAVRESLHPELGDAVWGAGWIGHAAQHAADVDDAAYEEDSKHLLRRRCLVGRGPVPGMFLETWLDPGLLALDTYFVACQVRAQPSAPPEVGGPSCS